MNDATSQVESSSMGLDSQTERAKILSNLRSADGIIGHLDQFISPFEAHSVKPLLYVDWTASARCVKDIEDYVQREVMPFYGNTHTTTSIIGHQSTCFHDEARQIVAQATNAKVTGKAWEDAVIFTGSGTTAAVDKLIQSLGLNNPAFLFDEDEENENDDGGDGNISKSQYRPIVFTTSYEHHSNLLPWRESSADVVTIAYNESTGVDLLDLEQKLQKYRHRKIKIGAMSAASNVTGILTAVDEVCILLHSYNAWAFFDYATAAPYVRIDMNPTSVNPLAYKDGIYFSGHKFLGGPGSPGALIVKRNILLDKNTPPSVVGGGTVFYVTEDHHRYLSVLEHREEGGTPNLIGDIKLGLAMHLKQSIGARWIEEEELRLSQLVWNRLQQNDHVVLVGRGNSGESSTVGRYLPIFSFLVKPDVRVPIMGSNSEDFNHIRSPYFLHHNFVCALLNDLFGVQMRGGCQCAGPFSQQLLGLSGTANRELEAALLEKHELLRPGYTRFSIPFWMSEKEVEYVLDAVDFVANHGVEFMPVYRYNHKTGEWAHSTRLTKFPERKWLSHFNVSSIEVAGGSNEARKDDTRSITSHDLLANAMKDARIELEAMKQQNTTLLSKATGKTSTVDSDKIVGAWEHLRWFLVQADMLSISHSRVTLFREEKDIIIQPSTHELKLNNGSKEVTEVTLSSYATKRDKKLSVNVGKGRTKPQYLKLFLSKEDFEIFNQFKESVSMGHPPLVRIPESKHKSSKKESNITVGNGNDGQWAQEENVTIPLGTEENPSSETNAMGLMCDTGKCLMPIKQPRHVSAAAFKHKPIQPPKKILKAVGQCIRDWSMIKDGDRLLLGLSGGKDSLSLLHVLIALQKKAPVKFTIACATVDPQTESFDPSPLIPYMESLGIEYHYLSRPIVEMASTKLQGDSLCAFCSRFKRGLLYTCCREHNYNKLVLAQHLDDLAESFMMSIFHNGTMRTMKAHYSINAGDLHVIRPFAYLRESQCRDFAQSTKMPIINENCKYFAIPNDIHYLPTNLHEQLTANNVPSIIQLNIYLYRPCMF